MTTMEKTNDPKAGGAGTRMLRLGACVAAVAVAGAAVWFAATQVGSSATTVASAENAEALGNTLGNNDTAAKGSYDAYDPEAEAEATGGVAIEGSEEEQLQQERIAGGSVGEVTSDLEHVDGIVDGDGGDYVATYGMSFQAPDLTQTLIDAIVESGSTAGLPENHIDAGLTLDECASCHAIIQTEE